MTWRDREQKLGARLGRLPPLRQGMLVIPRKADAPQFEQYVTSPTQLRRALPRLGELLRAVSGGTEEEQRWRRQFMPRLARVLGRLMAQGDLLAAAIHALCLPLFEGPAPSLDHPLDPSVKLVQEIFDGNQRRWQQALETVARQRPPQLLWSLVDLCDVLESWPGIEDNGAYIRLALALHAFGGDAITALARSVPSGERIHLCGVLLELLDDQELDRLMQQGDRQLLAQVLAASGRPDADARLLGWLAEEMGHPDTCLGRLTLARLTDVLSRMPPPKVGATTDVAALPGLTRQGWLPAGVWRALVRLAVDTPDVLVRLMQTEAEARLVVFEELVALIDAGVVFHVDGLEAFLLDVVHQTPSPERIEQVVALGDRGSDFRAECVRLMSGLLAHEADAVALATLQECVTLGATELVPQIQQLADSGAPERRSAAVVALSRLGQVEEHLGRLVDLALDADPAARNAGHEVLRERGFVRLADLARSLFESLAGADDIETFLAEEHPLLVRMLVRVIGGPSREDGGIGAQDVIVRALGAMRRWVGQPVMARIASELAGADGDLGRWLEDRFRDERDLGVRAAVLALRRDLDPVWVWTPEWDTLFGQALQRLRLSAIDPQLLRAVLECRAGPLPLLQRRELADAFLEMVPLRAESMWPVVAELTILFLAGQLWARPWFGRSLTREVLQRALDTPELAEDLRCVVNLCAMVGNVEPDAVVLQFFTTHLARVLPRLLDLAGQKDASAERPGVRPLDLGILPARAREVLARVARELDRPQDVERLVESIVLRWGELGGEDWALSLLREALRTLKPMATPAVLLHLLQAFHHSLPLTDRGQRKQWDRIWHAAGVDDRVAMEGKLAPLSYGIPDGLLSVVPRQVVREFVLWWLQHDSEQPASLLSCLEKLIVEGAESQELMAMLGGAMRHVDSPSELVRRQALRVAAKVRALLHAMPTSSDPYRGGGSQVDLGAVDRRLAAAAPQLDMRQRVRDALDAVASASSETVEQVLAELSGARATWALPTVVRAYEQGVSAGLEPLFERTIEDLADALKPVRRAVCLTCVAHTVSRRVKTGLLSRVSYPVCEVSSRSDGSHPVWSDGEIRS